MIQECLACLDIFPEKKSPVTRPIPFVFTTTDKENGLCESVGEITCVAIPSYFEYVSTQQMTICQHLKSKIKRPTKAGGLLMAREEDSSGLLSVFEKEGSIEALLKLCTEWVVLKSGYHFKKTQIRNYTWLEKGHLEEAIQRLHLRIPDTRHIQYEKHMTFSLGQSVVTGFCSMVHPKKNEQWVLKMVTEVKSEHFIQAALFHWMGHKTFRPGVTTFLYNILDDRLYRVGVTCLSSFEHVICKLLDIRRHGLDVKSDQEFIASCLVH
jgi:hypothetical protein